MREDHEPRQPGEIRAFVEYHNQPRPARQQYWIGWDPGQSQDYSAIAILKKMLDKTYQVQHLERLALGTPYPAQVEKVYSMMHRKPLDKADVTLCIDATGIGAAVVDLAREKGTNPVAVSIHGGMEASWTDDRMSARVPKADLIGCLTVLAQTRSVTVARGLPYADTLRQELKAYQAKINPNTAHVTYGNDARQAPHDDLVLSVAIPLWTAENRYPRPNPICRLISVGGRHNW